VHRWADEWIEIPILQWIVSFRPLPERSSMVGSRDVKDKQKKETKKMNLMKRGSARNSVSLDGVETLYPLMALYVVLWKKPWFPGLDAKEYLVNTAMESVKMNKRKEVFWGSIAEAGAAQQMKRSAIRIVDGWIAKDNRENVKDKEKSWKIILFNHWEWIDLWCTGERSPWTGTQTRRQMRKVLWNGRWTKNFWGWL